MDLLSLQLVDTAGALVTAMYWNFAALTMLFVLGVVHLAAHKKNKK